MQIDLQAFKKGFPEPQASNGIDPQKVSEYMKKFYGEDPVSYNSNEHPYKKLKIRKQVEKICDHMEKLGLNNFLPLAGKFHPNLYLTPREIGVGEKIKECMEYILYQFENNKSQTVDLVEKYKDRKFLCRDGTLTNLENILAEMTLGSQGIDLYIAEQKKQFITQVTVEMYNQGNFEEYPWHKRQTPHMEIHNITSLLNSVAPEYGLQVKSRKDDMFTKVINDISKNKLITEIDHQLQKPENTNSFIEGIANNVVQNLPYYEEGLYQGSAFYYILDEHVKKLQIPNTEVSLFVNMENGIVKGYKPNMASIMQDVLTIHLHNKGMATYSEIDLIKMRVQLEKDLDFDGNSRVTQDTLDSLEKKGFKERALQYMIDNKMKLDTNKDDNPFPTADPVKYAIDNNIKIEGKEAQQYVLEKVAEEYLKTSNPQIKKELAIKFKEIHQMESEKTTEFLAVEPVKYAIDNNIKIEGKDAKQYALEKVIEEYLKTSNSDIKKELDKRYNEIHQMGSEKTSELLSVNSNLGKFLDNSKNIEVIANHSASKGQRILQDIDYTKCDLALIEKCVNVHEKSLKEKPRNYDNFTTVQKVGMAFSALLGPVGLVVAYFAIKAHNKAEKAELEKKIRQSLEGIQEDLSKLRQPKKLQPIVSKSVSFKEPIVEDKNNSFIPQKLVQTSQNIGSKIGSLTKTSEEKPLKPKLVTKSSSITLN
jgi:hypothetical protein